MLREFKSHMIENDLPLSYFFNAGTLIEQKDFEEQNYCARTVFIFVDDNYPESSSQRIMPESMYMTVYADDTTQEHVHARRMFTEMERMGYCADGDYPVSYTHLDVYKRQHFTSATSACSSDLASCTLLDLPVA